MNEASDESQGCLNADAGYQRGVAALADVVRRLASEIDGLGLEQRAAEGVLGVCRDFVAPGEGLWATARAEELAFVLAHGNDRARQFSVEFQDVLEGIRRRQNEPVFWFAWSRREVQEDCAS